jgi:hypothetical protein
MGRSTIRAAYDGSGPADLRTTYSLEELVPIAPADLAREFPDPHLRQQLVQD